MKILYFILGTLRKDILTWNNYINKSGFSGTEAQIIEFVTYLRMLGHDIWTFMPGFPDTEINKARLEREFVKNLDVFCIIGSFIKRKEVNMILKEIPVKCQIIVFYHSISDITDLMEHEYLERFKFVCVSNYVANQFNLKELKNELIIIPNGINETIYLYNKLGELEDINNLEFYKEKKGFSFITSFSRGGEMSYKIFNKYKNELSKSHQKRMLFFIADYFIPNKKLIEPLKKVNKDIIYFESLSKTLLKSLLNKTDYFIYPLYNPEDKIITHDTYGCSIHEALACGVTVITWDVACYREVFGDLIHLIPPIEREGYNPFGGNKEKNEKMGSDQAIELFIEKIREIESNQEKKLEDKIRGRKWALEGTWKKSIDKFLEFVKI